MGGSGMMNAKQKAIDELMGYLDDRDGKDLEEAMKPKIDGAEVPEVESVDGDSAEPVGEEAMAVGVEGEAAPKMSEDELAELIEAIQSKLGS